MGGKSGQQSKAPSYGGQPRRSSGGKGGKSGQSQGNAMGNYGQALGGQGKSGQPFQRLQGTMQNGMNAFGQQMQPGAENRWSGYGSMTASPTPQMPPNIGAPQTGAFPFGQSQQPQQPGVSTLPATGGQPVAQDPNRDRGMPGWGGRQKPGWKDPAGMTPEALQAYMAGNSQFKVAPNTKGIFQIDPGFYDSVVKTLGNAYMAKPGEYDKGWNSESSPNTRAQATAWAKQMEGVLGRPLTRNEISQLEQRAKGWGFYPVGTDKYTGQKVGPFDGAQFAADIAAIQAGKNVGQPQFASADPNELTAHQKQWLGIP